jgi:hypothetical protein
MRNESPPENLTMFSFCSIEFHRQSFVHSGAQSMMITLSVALSLFFMAAAVRMQQ